MFCSFHDLCLLYIFSFSYLSFRKKKWELFTSFLRANLIILIDSNKSTLDIIFFLSGFSFTDTGDSQDSRGREGTIFYSTLPLPPAHEHSDIYLQLCMWDDYHIFLIATLVFTRLLLDEILPPYRITIWLIDDVKFVLVCLLDDLILGFCYSNLDTGNRWTRARIDYHPCITSEPTNQVC